MSTETNNGPVSSGMHEAVQSDGEMHMTLAISQAEAESGTTRILTLPGGRQVGVMVPAGVGDGSTLRLEEKDLPSYAGGPTGPLVLTIVVTAAASAQPLPHDISDATIDVAKPNAEQPAIEDPFLPPSPNEGPGYWANTATPPYHEVATPAHPVKPAHSATLRWLGVGLIIIVGLVGLLCAVSTSYLSSLNTYLVPATTPTLGMTEYPIPTAKSGPWGIVAGPDGNLWFTELDLNKIGRITTNGAITEFPLPTTESGPEEITVGPDRNLWFTEVMGNQIGSISTSGSITEFIIPTADSYPGGIVAGPDGNLWFVESVANKIGRASTSGTITEYAIPTDDSFPVEIAAGPNGTLWFTESLGNKIGHFRP